MWLLKVSNWIVLQDLLLLFPTEFFFLWSMCCVLFYGVYYYDVTKESVSVSIPDYRLSGVFFLIFYSMCLSLADHLLFSNNFLLDYSNFFFSTSFFVENITIALLIFGLVYVALTKSYFIVEKLYSYEFYILFYLFFIGFFCLIKAESILSCYLALEIISLAFYVLASFKTYSEYSTESGLKYFVLGVFGSAFLLLSGCFFYILYGTLDLRELGTCFYYVSFLGNNYLSLKILSFLAVSFFLLAFFLKLGIVPLHSWVPDVYEGAPTIVTALFSTLPKFLFFCFVLEVLDRVFFSYISELKFLFQFGGIFSILVGTFFAIGQTRIKRLYAYSSIIHAGYLLLALSSTSYYGYQFFFFYLFFYIVTTLGLFSILLALIDNASGIRIKYLSELPSLSVSNGYLSFIFSIFLFSLAGIPPMIGFFSKFYIFSSLFFVNEYTVATLILVFSVLGAFYYVYLVRTIYFLKIYKPISFVVPSKYISYLVSSSCIMVLFGFVYISPCLFYFNQLALSLIL